MLQEIVDDEKWNLAPLTYPFGNGINLSMRVSDVEAKYNELKSKGIKMFRELEVHKYRCDDVEYSDSEFLLQDPDGYLLRFNNQYIKKLNKKEEYLRKQVKLAFLNTIELQGLRKEAVERGFTPLKTVCLTYTRIAVIIYI